MSTVVSTIPFIGKALHHYLKKIYELADERGIEALDSCKYIDGVKVYHDPVYGSVCVEYKTSTFYFTITRHNYYKSFEVRHGYMEFDIPGNWRHHTLPIVYVKLLFETLSKISYML